MDELLALFSIQDRWRDDPPPCLHCVLIIVFKASQNKQAALSPGKLNLELCVDANVFIYQ